MTDEVKRDTIRADKKYGWIRDLPDYRDHYFAPKRDVLNKLPTSVDLRSMMPAIYNQGSLGSCTAQALGALLQYDEIKQNKADKNTPSRLFIYYNERVLMGTVNSDSGSSLRGGIQAISMWGFPDESLWTYDITKYAVKPTADAYKAGGQEKVTKAIRVYQDIAHIKAALASGQAVAFGFSVYQNFETQTVATTGIMPMPSGYLLGGHAVLAVGYNDSSQSVLVRNSWGPSWGLQGYFWMPYAYITSTSLAADFWTVSAIP